MTTSAKVAMVTGAGTGIGKAAALALLEEGYRVVLAGRRRELLEKTASESGAEKRVLVVPTDVSDPGSVRALFAKTREAYGRLDVLFNNAGINVPGVPLEDITYEQWRQVVDTQIRSDASAIPVQPSVH